MQIIARISSHIERFIYILNTIRFLKMKQIFYQFYYRVQRIRSLAVKCPDIRMWFKEWKSPNYRMPCLLENGDFIFLEKQDSIDRSIGWNDLSKPKLWLYNLHYLDALNCLNSNGQNKELFHLIDEWIMANPPFSGVGWEPYTISLRIVNLVKWYSRNGTNLECELPSLALQTHVLSKKIEYHILGNHIFENAKALIFAGAFFSSKKSESWLSLGLRILDREIKEQFLPDGAHFELSPMYHSILLWDLCDLIYLAEVSKISALIDRIPEWHLVLTRGLHWLEAMVHPDGDIPFFNDATFRIAPTLNDLKVYAELINCKTEATQSSGLSVQHLKPSGFISVLFGQGNKLLLDVANTGASYQPGHAHADTLSFEMSLFGSRVFVNSGISVYGAGSERLRQRSTMAHNTVVVDGKNSSEVWSGFRMARRARPFDVALKQSSNSILASAKHDGYKRLAGKTIHSRSWEVTRNSVLISDELAGVFTTAEAYFYIHPDITVHRLNDGHYQLSLISGHLINVSFLGSASIALIPSFWHNSFGASLNNVCFLVKFNKDTLCTRISWG